MLAEMTSGLASEWMAYHRVRPSDAIRGAAQVCATISNTMGVGDRRFSPTDFLPARPVEFEQDPEDMKAAFHSVSGG